jgi:type I restriction enzyme S subunit
MEVKAGYKQTDVGLMPDDWALLYIRDLVASGSLEKPLDGNHGNIHPKSSDYVQHGIPFIMANNFQRGQVDTRNCKFITRERADRLQKGFSLAGDVLLTHKGTIGLTAIVGEDVQPYLMLTPQVTYYRVREPSALLNQFLRHYFDSTPFQSLFKSLSGGGTRAYLGIRKQLDLPVLIPPLSEQQAIADALSDVDALIASLDALIAKKRDLKQAAMEQLLTGKTRLQGFSGDWETQRLGDIASLYQPQTISAKQFTETGYPVYGANGIVGCYHSANHHTWQVTVTCRGSTCGTVNRTVDECWITGNAMVLNCDQNTKLNKDYFYSVMLRLDLKDCISGTGQPQIVRSPLANVRVILATSMEEQRAIADVLSDMDAELSEVEQRRDKTIALKQGMMQELLTGRTRLV